MKPRYYLAPLACALIALAGCGKKKSDEGGGEPVDTTEYTLNVRTPGEGSGLRGEFKIDMKMTMDVRDRAGRPLPEAKDQDIKEEIAYHETIEAFPDGSKKPTKTRVKIDKWEKAKGASGITKDGVMSRIVGREIVIEKVGGFYDFRAADGDAIDPNVRFFLDQRYQELYEGFNIHDFLPGKPVRPYSSWDIPIKRVVGAMGRATPIPFDAQKSTGTARLTRVYTKDGRQYGHIELSADIVPKFPEKGITVNEAKIELKWEIDLCIDGSRHDISATALVNSSFDISHPKEGTGKITAKGTVTLTEVEEKVGKAAKPAVPKRDDPAKKAPADFDGWPVPDVDAKGETKKETSKEDSDPRFDPPPPPKQAPRNDPGPKGKKAYPDEKFVVPPPPGPPAPKM